MLFFRQRQFSQFVIFLLCASFWKTTESLDSYDFIIVGGGTAGCALARRLSDDGEFSVLLLESGGLPKEGMEIPVNAPKFVADPEVTFMYPTLPQRFASRRTGGEINLIGGRVMGGTSSINYMWFNRGNPRDWKNYAAITHDDSWTYENMLPFFKNVETYAGEFRTTNADEHGFEGPLTITRPKYAPGLDYWLNAGKELGYKVLDANGPQKPSFAPVEFSKKFGRRQSSFVGYLQPMLESRHNLHILLNTNATQILFEGINAAAVRFHTRSPGNSSVVTEHIAHATKEIILCSGVIGTPLLLQRSGIGPKSLLEAAHIPVVRGLPVGSSFQDHVSLPIHLAVNMSEVVMDENRDLTPANLQLFNVFGDGPYSNTRGGTGQAFAVSSLARLEGEEEWPDLHLCMAHSVQPYLSAYLAPNSTTGINSQQALQPHEVQMSASVFLVRPRSRGSVYINPDDINGVPLLDVGYFSDPNDIQRLLDGVKETIRIFENTESYKKIGARLLPVDFPACQNRVFKSDQYWKCYIRHASQAGLHAGGTCRMGSGQDPLAVVDSKLRVIGVAGLRCADASIMPAQVAANTQAAVYAIAEKAADMILNFWNFGIV